MCYHEIAGFAIWTILGLQNSFCYCGSCNVHKPDMLPFPDVEFLILWLENWNLPRRPDLRIKVAKSEILRNTTKARFSFGNVKLLFIPFDTPLKMGLMSQPLSQTSLLRPFRAQRALKWSPFKTTKQGQNFKFSSVRDKQQLPNLWRNLNFGVISNLAGRKFSHCITSIQTNSKDSCIKPEKKRQGKDGGNSIETFANRNFGWEWNFSAFQAKKVFRKNAPEIKP